MTNLKNPYVCIAREDRDHCNTKCPHGVPHQADECTPEEFCTITNSFVRCIRVGQRTVQQFKERGLI